METKLVECSKKLNYAFKKLMKNIYHMINYTDCKGNFLHVYNLEFFQSTSWKVCHVSTY